LYRTPPFVSLTCVSPVRLVQCCTEHLHLWAWRLFPQWG
jgi:hypothetical protein